MHKVDQSSYMDYTFLLKEGELELRRVLCDWLPNEIIDSHAHSAREDDVEPMTDQAFSHMMSTFPKFNISDSKRVHHLLYPGKRVRVLRFAHAFRSIDHKSVNAYLLADSPEEDRVALYGLPTDVEYTIQSLREERVSALKMYHAFFTPPAGDIYDYFRPEVLEEAQGLGVPIILHPPFIVTRSLGQIQRLLRDFPRLIAVIAHLGLTKKVVPGLEEAYQALAKYDRLFMDTSLVPSSEVVGLALQTFGADRILFGSDEPLNLIRAKAYNHPKLGQRLVTEFKYHWVEEEEHEEYKHLAKGVTHSHWQCMRAIKDAVESLPQKNREQTKNRIFCENAKEVYGF